jgi:hypothetical protein
MRIRRTVIAPLILTIGAIGSLVAAPAAIVLTSGSAAATPMAYSSNVYYYHA